MGGVLWWQKVESHHEIKRDRGLVSDRGWESGIGGRKRARNCKYHFQS